MKLPTLVELCKQFNLRNDTHYDEGGTDKEFNHRYCSLFYDKEFTKYRDQDIRLLEVGVHRGGSLQLWHHYFSKALIYGVDPFDFGPKAKTAHMERVRINFTDGYDYHVSIALPTFDIVIDDGPHTKESHEALLKLYIPRLRVGGVLVIEDIADINWIDDYIKLVPENCTYEIVDVREQAEIWDSLLFVVRSGV